MAEARIIDGKAFAAALRGRVAEAAGRLQRDHKLTPGLAVVLVGEDPASVVYTRNKARQAVEAGMNSFRHSLRADTSQAALLTVVERLDRDDQVHGILVQLPLPDQINSEAILTAIDPAKDIDGFHLINAGGLATGGRGGLIPCTPQGCMMLLKAVHRDLTGLKALVAGRSNIVGKPMASLLLGEDCTVTMAHSRTRDLAAVCREADILVAAVGRARMVQPDWVKPGAAVIDVGVNVIGDKLVGDVDFAGLQGVAGLLTPPRGGVGPMTITMLLRNTLYAYRGHSGA